MNSTSSWPYEHVQRFSLTHACAGTARAFLSEFGFVVFADVLCAAQCDRAMDRFWEWMAEVTGSRVRRGEISSYEHWPPSIDGTAILSYNGIGQSEFCWSVRDQTTVESAFATLWGQGELIASFDGAVMARAWQTHPQWRTQENWFHVDQHPLARPGFECVQGLVNLLDSTETSAGNLLIPKSHLQFQRYATDYPDLMTAMAQDTDYFVLPSEDPLVTQAPALARQIHLQRGDLLCWDSRTAHCNTPGTDGKAVDRINGLTRAAVLVCMTPRGRASDTTIAARKAAATEQITTTHWPHRFYATHRHDDWTHHQRNADPIRFPAAPANMTPRRLRLIGYTNEEVRRLSEAD